ncbi:MAG: LysM peptidoglycan-binding domain-containing protein [Treponema sp.]|nr:LysM peptidoglycan-binding domain-containing protein [Treponema sp.]
MGGTIGIKVADGNFYPILGENVSVGKKLVLTTVHDEQNSVQIDLYRSFAGSMLDAQYIGSLLVQDIRPGEKGEASVCMTISVDGDGYITAEAFDLNAPPESDHHILNVSLRTLDTVTDPEDFPDFDLDQPAGIGSRKEPVSGHRGLSWGILAAAVIVALGIAILWFLLLRGTLAGRPERPQEERPALTGQASSVEPPSPGGGSEPPVIVAPTSPPEPAPPAARERPPAPVMSYRVPQTIPPNGISYEVRWGDTLWDIAAAFYRDPLLYPRIARHNNIANPDRILAGFPIRVPPLP